MVIHHEKTTAFFHDPMAAMAGTSKVPKASLRRNEAPEVSSTPRAKASSSPGHRRTTWGFHGFDLEIWGIYVDLYGFLYWIYMDLYWNYMDLCWFIYHDLHLVGGFSHLEKYEFVNGKDDIPYILENKKDWNHQPDMDLCWFTIDFIWVNPIIHQPELRLFGDDSPY